MAHLPATVWSTQASVKTKLVDEEEMLQSFPEL